VRAFDAGAFVIPNGASESQEISTQLRDADTFFVTPPAVLAEADVQLQLWNGSSWSFYDATNFVAGVDNYKTYEARGLKYRLRKRAGTVAAERTFEVVKRVGNE
jgi:hypothetical protein